MLLILEYGGIRHLNKKAFQGQEIKAFKKNLKKENNMPQKYRASQMAEQNNQTILGV